MLLLLRNLLGFVIGVVEVLLTFRFVLKLFGANPAAEFVNWIYQTTEPILQPFFLAFPSPAIEGQFILEFTTLFAIFVYAFIGYILQELLDIIATGKVMK